MMNRDNIVIKVSILISSYSASNCRELTDIIIVSPRIHAAIYYTIPNTDITLLLYYDESIHVPNVRRPSISRHRSLALSPSLFLCPRLDDNSQNIILLLGLTVLICDNCQHFQTVDRVIILHIIFNLLL